MRTCHPKPETQGDTSDLMLGKLAKLGSAEMWAVVEGGPDSSISGHIYAECYWEACRRERAAVESLEL